MADNMADPPDGQPADGTPVTPQLPVVWSPKVDAGEGISEELPHAESDAAMSSAAAEAADVETDAPSSAPAGDAPLLRSLRFALLAASIAGAAAIGSFIGSLSAFGVAHLWPAEPAGVAVAMASSPQAAKAELAELSALKASLDAAARNASGQFAKLADRLDHMERAQIEPALKLARIADAVDRLDKKNVTASAATAALETTGSIASAPPAATADAKLPDKVIPDWIVQDVRGGRALIESRYGAVFEVAAGSVLPGLGRIDAVKRQDGQWVVVTAHGVIVGP
jgi:hypothetical protein